MALPKVDEKEWYNGVPYFFYDVDGAAQEYTSDRSRIVGEVGEPAADAYNSWAVGCAPPYAMDERMLSALSLKARMLLAFVTHHLPRTDRRIVVFTASKVVAAALRQLLNLCLHNLPGSVTTALYLGRQWRPHSLRYGVPVVRMHHRADDVRALCGNVQLLIAYSALLDAHAPPPPRGGIAILYDGDLHVNQVMSLQKRFAHSAVHVFRLKENLAKQSHNFKRSRASNRQPFSVDKETEVSEWKKLNKNVSLPTYAVAASAASRNPCVHTLRVSVKDMVLPKPQQRALYCGVPFAFYDVDSAEQDYASERSRLLGEVGEPAVDAYHSWAVGCAPLYAMDWRMVNKLSPKAEMLLMFVIHHLPLKDQRIVVLTGSIVEAAALRQLLDLFLRHLPFKVTTALYLGRQWRPDSLKRGVSATRVHHRADDARALLDDVELLFAHVALLDTHAPQLPRGAIAVLFDGDVHVNMAISAQKRLAHSAVHVLRHKENFTKTTQYGKRQRISNRPPISLGKDSEVASASKKAPHGDMHYQHVPHVLRGPSVGDVGHLYAFVLPEEKQPPDPFQLFDRTAFPSNAARFAVVLSAQLHDRDCTLRLSDIGCDVDVNVGDIRLVFVGARRWTNEDLSLARSWHKLLFSTVTSTKADAFQWQNGEHFANYIVVPLFCDEGAYHVDFASMNATLYGSSYNEEPSTQNHRGVQRHVEKVEGTLVLGSPCKKTGKRELFLTGCAKYTMCPISRLRLKWCFNLNSVGAICNTDHIHHLVNAIEVPDADCMVPFTNCFPPSNDPQTAQRFDPQRNREKERDRWYGDVIMDIERKSGGGVFALHQPLVSTLWLKKEGGRMPLFDMAALCRLLSGTPLREVVTDVVESANARNTYFDHFQIPEKLQPHPHFAPLALFLPAILVCLRRHLELCELRSLILNRNAQHVRLSHLSLATTTPFVDNKHCYERLEFLGDSWLKAVATLYVFMNHPYDSESVLHDSKKACITNDALAASVTTLRGHGIDLMNYLRTTGKSVKRWTPPGAQLSKLCFRIHDKLPADIIEALCAAVGLYALGDADSHSSSWPTSLKQAFQACTCFLHRFGPLRRDDAEHDSELLRVSMKTLHGEGSIRNYDFLNDDREGIARRMEWAREKLEYNFKHPLLLLVALTGKGYATLRRKERHALLFERFEHLGDALVAFYMSTSIYQSFRDDSPGELTALFGLAVSNEENLARIAAHIRLDGQLYLDDRVKQDAVTRNALRRRRRAAKRAKIRRGIDGTPKILYDALEAVLGAVWVDGGLFEACRVAHHVLGETVTLLERQLYDRPVEMRVRREISAATGGICKETEIEQAKNLWVCKITVSDVEVGQASATSKKHAQELAYRHVAARLKGDDRAVLIGSIRQQMRAYRPMARPFGGG